jgi:hypothetical protein
VSRVGIVKRALSRAATVAGVVLLIDCGGGGGTQEPNTPSLSSLVVSPLVLQPAFDSGVYDYYVQCAAGTNHLTVTLAADAGTSIAIVSPAPAAANGLTNVTMDVAENDAIVASATLGSVTTSYWVRCLPHDFPPLAMTAHPENGTPTPGYYLVGNTLHDTGEGGYAIALDVRGVPVWYHTTSNGNGAANVDIRGYNSLSFVGNLPYTFSDSNGAYEIHALPDDTVSFVLPNGAPLDEHELRQLDNGHFLLFSRDIETGWDLTGLGSYGPNEDIVNCVIHEVDQSGNSVWQWKATDHLDPVKDCTYPQGVEAVTDAQGTQVVVVDPFHCNSIDVADNGDLLVSARHMNALMLISKATGKITWKMGGSSYTKDGAAHVNVEGDSLGGFHFQHDARFHSDGTISVFDDESYADTQARALVLSYDVTKGTAQIVWQHPGWGNAGSMGSFREMGDGTRIIGWGGGGKNPTFTELDPDGKEVLDFTFNPGDESYRAIKVETKYLNLDWMRRTAGTK